MLLSGLLLAAGVAGCGGDRAVSADAPEPAPATGTATIRTDAGPPVSPEPDPAARLWTITTSMLQTADDPLRACYITLTSLPPAGCSGVEVRGVEAMQVPGATAYPNGTVTIPAVMVVGTWDGDALTLTEPPTPAQAPAGEPYEPLRPPCPEPAGGWPVDRFDVDGVGRVAAYADAQPDAGTPYYDEGQKIFVLRFTGDLDRHRREVAEIYDGPVCVTTAPVSARALAELAKSIQPELEASGLSVLSVGGGNARDTVEIMVDALDPVGIASWEDRHPYLSVTSFLTPR